MLQTLVEALEGTGLSQALRESLWLYPMVNTGHVLGIALLFGAIVPLDLRLLGLWRGVPVDHLARPLVSVASTGLVLAVGTGTLLFTTRPADYVVEPLFGVKMALLALAVTNALLLRRVPRWRQANGGTSRAAGALSIALWLGVIAAGRLIGYR
jgi:hypothetical protein